MSKFTAHVPSSYIVGSRLNQNNKTIAETIARIPRKNAITRSRFWLQKFGNKNFSENQWSGVVWEQEGGQETIIDGREGQGTYMSNDLIND